MDGRLRLVEQVEPETAEGRAPGTVAGVWLLLGGIVLTCTGVGAIVGIPLVIVGLAMPMARRTSADTERRASNAAGDGVLTEAAPERRRGRGAGAAR